MLFSLASGSAVDRWDKAEIVIVCKYSVSKEGLVTAKITDFEGNDQLKEKVKAALGVGLEFGFKWQVKGDAATIDDVTGEKTEQLKGHLEGEYEKK